MGKHAPPGKHAEPPQAGDRSDRGAFLPGIRPALMDLWLVRHGEAMSAQENPARPLTPEGARAVSAIAETLAGRMGSFDLVAASGKKRALETAAILAEATGYPAGRIAETGALSPNATPETFLAFLKENEEAERLLCVGHLPSIALIAACILSPGDPVHLAFGPGTVCRIRVGSLRRGGGELLLFLNGPGWDREGNMPYVNVRITREGASAEQKAEVIRRMTQVLVDVLKKNPETTVVVIDEVETDNWGIGGITVTKRRQRQA